MALQILPVRWSSVQPRRGATRHRLHPEAWSRSEVSDIRMRASKLQPMQAIPEDSHGMLLYAGLEELQIAHFYHEPVVYRQILALRLYARATSRGASSLPEKANGPGVVRYVGGDVWYKQRLQGILT